MRLSISSSSSAAIFILLAGGATVSSFQTQPLTTTPSSMRRKTLISKPSFSSLPTTTTTTTTLTRLEALPELSSLSLSSSIPSLPQSITAPIGSLSVLAFVILIHELGHFLAARSFNINVQEFSVGVGPKIFGFKRNVETGVITFGDATQNKGVEGSEKGTAGDTDIDTDTDTDTVVKKDENEIEFNLRAIPLGGYVRFPENYNTTQEFQLEVQAEKKRDEIQRTILEQKNGAANSDLDSDSSSSSSGGASDGRMGLVASITNVWDGYTNPKKQTEERLLALEAMAKSSKFNAKDNTSSNNWFQSLFNNKNKKDTKRKERSIIIEEDGTVSTPPIEYYDNPNLLQNRGWGQRAVVLAGGVVFNILLAFSLYFGELTVGGGMLRPTFDQGVLINSTPKVNGPSAGILNRGDVILSLNGQPLSSTSSPSVYTSQEMISQFISKIRTTTPGEALHLSVLQSNTKSISDIDVYPSSMNADDPSSPLSIGVMIGPNYKGQETIKASSLGNAVSIASTEVYESTSQNAQAILTYLGTLVQGKSGSSGQSLSGPIGVIKAGSDVVSTNNISAVIGFAAAISINLAVVNALPLPALDGGQMVFVLAEAVTGRKVDQRVQESINSAALLFLLVVTFSTAIGDITKIAVK